LPINNYFLNVFAFELFSEFVYHFLEDPLVDIATHEHQDKPIADLTSAEDGFDLADI
jgi:hypothetical protein